MRLKKKWIIAIAPFMAAAFIFIIGELVMSLWNWIAAGILGLPAVTFWQAWGLLILCRILFGSMGGGGRGRHRRRSEMTPEERERLRQNLRSRWGCDAPAGEGGAAS